jgi:hypothetical protein
MGLGPVAADGVPDDHKGYDSDSDDDGFREALEEWCDVTSASLQAGVVQAFVDGKPFAVLVGDEEKAAIANLLSSTNDWLATDGTGEDCRSRLVSNQAIVDSLLQPLAHEESDFEVPLAGWEPWQNPTELMLLLWVMSFGITRRAYLGIRRIVRASFSHYAEKIQWPSWPTLKGRVTAALPILPLYIANVRAGAKNVRFPFHRLQDVIRRLLMFPGAFEKMVFEPLKGGQSSELWHGDLWSSSPLFSYLKLTGSDGTVFARGADVQYLDGVELRFGRIVGIYRREEADGSTGDLQCQITPYTSDPFLGYQYEQGELLLDWSLRLEIVASDLRELVTVSKCRCHRGIDGRFCDTAMLRSPAGDPVTTVLLEEMPPRAFDETFNTMDFVAFERAQAEYPDLKVLSLFVVSASDSLGVAFMLCPASGVCYLCRCSSTMISGLTTSQHIPCVLFPLLDPFHFSWSHHGHGCIRLGYM